MSKEQSSNKNQQRSKKSSGERGQPRIYRSSRKPPSDVVFTDSRKLKKRTVNAQRSTSEVPISLKGTTAERSFRFQNNARNVTSDRSARDNSSRRHRLTYRRSRRQRFELSPQVNPSPKNRTEESRMSEKQTCRQISHDASQEKQIIDENLSRNDDDNVQQQAPVLTGSVEGTPHDGTSPGRKQEPIENGGMNNSIEPTFPNFSPSLFGPNFPPVLYEPHFPPAFYGQYPPSNIRDFPRTVFPLPAFGRGFGGIPPDFHLPPQATFGAGVPPGIYVPLQATQGMPQGLIPNAFCPPPGFGVLPRFHIPHTVAAETGTPTSIYPLPHAAHGTVTSLDFVSDAAFGANAPFGFYPSPQAVLGPGALPRFHSPSNLALGTSPMLPSQQSLNHERLDQPFVTVPLPHLPIGSEIFGTVPSASTSAATTALLQTLPSGSPAQQRIFQPQWSELDYAKSMPGVMSSYSDPYALTTTNGPVELILQFSLPIVRLFGGLFVHNFNESHYVTTDSMPSLV